MRPGSRYAVLLTAGGLLLVILLWALVRDGTPVPSGSDQAIEPSATASTELPAGDFEPEADEAVEVTSILKSGGSTTKPESSGAAGTPATTEALPELPSAEQQVVLRDVEAQITAAFDGDQNEAVALAAFLNQCQFTFRDRNRVEHSINNAERSFAEGQPLTQFRPSSPAQTFDTLQDFSSNQWNTFFRCEAARSLVNDAFWSNLEEQADAGNPVARYLFATLARNGLPQALAFENWDVDLQYREQAREYTWRNLDEREPLGLLALVEMEGRGMGMRGTRAAASTNTVLLLAAVKCGLSTPELLQSVDQLLESVGRMEEVQPGALERLNTASDQARRMFCKDSLER